MKLSVVVPLFSVPYSKLHMLSETSSTVVSATRAFSPDGGGTGSSYIPVVTLPAGGVLTGQYPHTYTIVGSTLTVYGQILLTAPDSGTLIIVQLTAPDDVSLLSGFHGAGNGSGCNSNGAPAAVLTSFFTPGGVATLNFESVTGAGFNGEETQTLSYSFMCSLE
jgi:hypothetical protein